MWIEVGATCGEVGEMDGDDMNHHWRQNLQQWHLASQATRKVLRDCAVGFWDLEVAAWYRQLKGDGSGSWAAAAMAKGAAAACELL